MVEPLSRVPTPLRRPAKGALLFGYRHVGGVPRCPCGDPGDYMMCEQGDGPLDFVLRCWCGATLRGTWDDEQDRATFLAGHSGSSGTPHA